LVLDEPMAGLDRSSRQALAEVTTTLRSTTTMITVTHDLDDSKPLGSRVLHLEAGRLISDTR
jgi:zinc transport system ATP-binding protein